MSGVSDFDAVIFAPFLHNLNEIFNLGVVCALEHLNNFDKFLFAFCSCDHHLEDSDGCSALALPKLWVGIKSFKYIKCFNRVIELAHFVGVVGDEVEEGQTFI